MATMHVRKGDNVKILTGKDKGKTGRILEVGSESGRVVVDGANIIIKHSKAKSAQSQSSRAKQPGGIDASNVQVICPSCNKPTRVGKVAVEVKGKTKFVRACKKCAAKLDVKQDNKKADKKAKKSKKDEVAEEVKATSAEPKKTAKKPPKGEVEPPKGGDGVKEKNKDGAIV